MPHFTAITVDRFINTGASNSVDRPNQGTRTVRNVSSTNSKPWDYLRLEKRYSMPSTRRPVVEKGDASNLKNATEISVEKGSGSDVFASKSSSRVWRTSSDSIISELGNGAIINECQIGCSNLENGVAVEEGKNDVRNGHIGEDGCEMPSTGSHGAASESSSHVWLTASDSVISEHVNDANINECQIGCINLEKGIPVDEGNDDVRNGHIGEGVCEMPFIDALGRENESEDVCVPHDSVWLTASDSVISEHVNDAIINESQIECINLESEIAVEEGNDVRNGRIGEDFCEMPSTNSLGRESDIEDLCVTQHSIWLTASGSIISEHMNVAVINESQIGCSNLENGVAVEEGKNDVRNGHIGEDGCEMPSTGSHGVASESSSHVWLTASDSISSEHENDAIINECQIGCINSENGISVEEVNDDVRNGLCEMPSTDALGRESDSEDLCVPHDAIWLTASDSISSEHVNDAVINESQIGCINLESEITVEEGNDDVRNGHLGEDVCEMPSTYSLGRESDSEDLCNCQDLVSSYTSLKDEEECDIFSSLATPTPGVEFYDAWEELPSVQNSVNAALEEQLVEIRLTLAIETETRKQAEEALANMQRRWEIMREHLSLVGLTLPSSSENEAKDSDPAEEMVCQQIQVIRFVSESIGRAIGKAEAVTEMENQVEAKNFEITRLCDRLHYYEAVNREMSQRNQQVAAEGTRRLGKRRKWRRRWIWGSIGVTVSIGVVAVACKYLQTGKSSSTMDCSIEE